MSYLKDGEKIDLRWYLPKEVYDALGKELWFYIQQRASMVGGKLIVDNILSEDMCNQLIEIGQMLERRKHLREIGI